MLKKVVKNIFRKLGLSVESNYEASRSKRYTNLLEKLLLIPKLGGDSCTIIIFSKDRAMQLDALLRSFYHFASHPPEVKVLYNASTADFEQAYDLLISKFESERVEFIKERQFKTDLVSILAEDQNSKVLFLVDDILFKKRVDFNDFCGLDVKKYVPSLRMGQHLTYSYTTRNKQPLPRLSKIENPTEMLRWDFTEGKLDWAYPLSVDGHLFSLEEMRLFAKELDYKAPNSFEEALQLMVPLFKRRLGLCYAESIIVNNPCNKVQAENDNLAGSISVEELNRKYQEGFQIDFKAYEGLSNSSAHEELSMSFISRE